MSAAPLEGARPAPLPPLGRCFVGPWFDTLLIGGGLSLLVVLVLGLAGRLGRGALPQDTVLLIVLLVNSTHFAASTVRLYTKPDTWRELPFMTMGLPLASVVVVTLGLVFARGFGDNLYALYLSWSPYHYAAQTYGLSAMYAVRSGCRLGGGERSLLWWTCMAPFAHAFVTADGNGLGWFVPPDLWVAYPLLIELRGWTGQALELAVFALPALLFWRVRSASPVGLPWISSLIIVTNGVWWIVFSYVDAFVWATVFHGVQYLAIVIIFHLRDHPPTGSGALAWIRPALSFYAMSLVLAYALFELWPYAYTFFGFSFAESALVCIAWINIHHFIVDRGIWRVRKDPNLRHVVS